MKSHKTTPVDISRPDEEQAEEKFPPEDAKDYLEFDFLLDNERGSVTNAENSSVTESNDGEEDIEKYRPQPIIEDFIDHTFPVVNRDKDYYKNLVIRKILLGRDILARLNLLNDSNHPLIQSLITETKKTFNEKLATNDISNEKQLKKTLTPEATHAFWERLIDICANYYDTHSKNVKKSLETEDTSVALLWRAIQGYNVPNTASNNKLHEYWPEIKTLDELVIAQQKIDYLEKYIKPEIKRLEEIANIPSSEKVKDTKKVKDKVKYLKNALRQNEEARIATSQNNAYNDLVDQIKNSAPETPLSEILRENSLYLTTHGDQKFNLTATVQSTLYQTSATKRALDNMRDKLADVNPYTVLSGNNYTFTPPPYAVLQQKAVDIEHSYRQKNYHLLLEVQALFTMYQKKWPWQQKNFGKFSQLFNEIKFLCQAATNQEKTYSLILSRIQDAFDKEERNYRKPYFSFGKEKSKLDFEKRLSKDDGSYTYPRALRELLYSKVLNPLTMRTSILEAKLTGQDPGTRIKRFPSTLSTHSIDVDDQDEDGNNSYYLARGKGRPGKKVGEGNYGIVNKALLKFTFLRDAENKVIGTEIDPKSWVKKTTKGKDRGSCRSDEEFQIAIKNTRQAVEAEVAAYKACAPKLKPSRVFSNNETNTHWFYMIDGNRDLESIMQGRSKIKLIREDYFIIFRDTLNQAYDAQISNRYIMYDIKLNNILYDKSIGKNEEHKDILKKEANIIDHGGSKPIDYLGDDIHQTSMYVPPNYHLGQRKKRTVYALGLVMAELIIGTASAQGPAEVSNYQKQREAGKENRQEFIELLQISGEKLGLSAIVKAIIPMIEIDYSKRAELWYAAGIAKELYEQEMEAASNRKNKLK